MKKVYDKYITWEVKELEDIVKKCIIKNPFDVEGKFSEIKSLFEKEIKIFSNEEIEFLYNLTLILYPGFFKVEFKKKDYQEIFGEKSDFPEEFLIKLENFQFIEIEEKIKERSEDKTIYFWRINPLLAHYFISSKGLVSGKLADKIISFHKRKGNPSYLFWYLLEGKAEDFDREVIPYVTTYALFYTPYREETEFLKEFLYGEESGNIFSIFYPWHLCFGEENDILDEEIEKSPYHYLSLLKLWIVERKIPTSKIFEIINRLFHIFTHEEKHGLASLDIYRIGLILTLARYQKKDFERIFQRLKSMEDELIEEFGTELKNYPEPEKIFFEVEKLILNCIENKKFDRDDMEEIWEVTSKLSEKEKKIYSMNLLQLFSVSGEFKNWIERWIDFISDRLSHPLHFYSELPESQKWILNKIYFEYEDFNHILEEYMFPDEIEKEILLPYEKKIILDIKGERGRITFEGNEIILTKQQTQILKDILEYHPGGCPKQKILRRFRKKETLKKAVQRLNNTLKEKGAPLKVEYNKNFEEFKIHVEYPWKLHVEKQ